MWPPQVLPGQHCGGEAGQAGDEGEATRGEQATRILNGVFRSNSSWSLTLARGAHRHRWAGTWRASPYGVISAGLKFRSDVSRASAGRPRYLGQRARGTAALIGEARESADDDHGPLRRCILFDPMMAVHRSNVEPLPLQITAVYESLLPRQPLRFVLADDPGAGKTIAPRPQRPASISLQRREPMNSVSDYWARCQFTGIDLYGHANDRSGNASVESSVAGNCRARHRGLVAGLG
jgi:hypothetical protein